MVDDENKKKGKAAMPRKKIETMTHTSAKPEVSDLIGQRLRNYYNEVALQPVPDGAPTDPWWAYRGVQARHADRWLTAVRQLAAGSTP